MKIIGSQTSPFTRITRVICEELQIPYEFEVTAPFGKLDEKQDKFIRTFNPLMKVPVLVDNDNVIIDSRVIIKYLLSRKVENNGFRTDFPRNIKEDNIMTVILGIIEAGTLKFILSREHPDKQTDFGYMIRCREKIKHGLTWLDNQPDLGVSFGVTEIALICGLEWFEKRNAYPWKDFSNLVRIYKMYYERPSFQKTGIPDSV